MKVYTLNYDADAHKQAKRKQTAKRKELAFILSELERMSINVLNIDRLKQMPLTHTRECYLEQHKAENTMNLNFNKLASLKGDDFTELTMAVGRYESIDVDIDRELTAEEFTTYTKTEEQNKRFEAVTAIIENIESIKHLNQPTTKIGLFGARPLNTIIEHDSHLMRYKPRTSYVLNGNT
jgi:hypothetical protein